MEQERILIVDDDPDITETMKVVLENSGYKVDCAANGGEAKEQIKTFKPNLIILDVMMDTLEEGITISRELKKDPRYKKIPIIIISAVKERTGIDFASAAGDEDWLPVEEFLDKPVKPELLLEKVRTLLNQ